MLHQPSRVQQGQLDLPDPPGLPPPSPDLPDPPALPARLVLLALHRPLPAPPDPHRLFPDPLAPLALLVLSVQQALQARQG